MITLAAIESLSGKNLVIKLSTFVKELHLAIKRLYSQNAIPWLHSCLKETIRTALDRFEQMAFIEATAFATKKGSTTKFVRCQAEKKADVQDLLERLHRHRSFSKED